MSDDRTISRAALIRMLPPGRRLTLVNTGFAGPCNKPRRVIRATKDAVTVEQLDKPGSQPAYLDFEKGDTITLTDDGFTVNNKDGLFVTYRWENDPCS